MIQVLIAEDEALTRIGIRFCLDRENSGYELVGEAENGKQALDMCLKLKPQILITDIKMPVMDGIELIRQIKARNLDIKIVILTCYEEFTYLHEAMHLGVDDYLLKVALKPDRLLEVLDKIKKKYFETAAPIPAASETRLEALESIIMGYIDECDEINRLVSVHHLDLDFDRYAMLLVDAEQDEDSKSYHRSSMLNRGIRAMLADCINIENHGEVAQCGFGRFAAFVYPPAELDDKQAASSLLDLAQRIFQVGTQSLNIKLTIGISNLHHGLSELAVAQEEAEQALTHSFFDQNKPICRFSDSQPSDKVNCSENLHLELKHIHDAVYAEDEAALQATIENFSNTIRTGNFSESEVRSWFMLAYMAAVSSFEDKTGIDLDSRQKMQSLKKMVLYASSIQEISREIQRLIIEITRHFGENSGRQTNTLIHQVTSYCNEHFSENITLEQISKKFGINITYFCKLFKRTMGVTFVDFLTDRRIKEAKRLIRNTDLPNYLIAQQTGFQNPEYFSKTFKKVTGVTPKEYKRSKESAAPSDQKS